MYRNDLYSNRSGSRNHTGGTWVYINGELYHSGVKGMQWGKHLPGTTWWKTTVNQYYKNNNISSQRVKDVDEKGKSTFRTYGPTFGQRVKANINAAGQAARIYGGYARSGISNAASRVRSGASNVANRARSGVSNIAKRISSGTSRFWNAGKGYSQAKIDSLKNSARDAYKYVRLNVKNCLNKYQSAVMQRGEKVLITGKSGMNHLQDYVVKEMFESIEAYNNASLNGPLGKTVNSFIQTAQYDVVRGCARFLDSIGLDDEVASFLKRFKKK